MLSTMMREAFGYDFMGNSPDLLCEKDKAELERGIPRAGGDVHCAKCGIKYVYHPAVQGALWATRTCTGLVKL